MSSTTHDAASKEFVSVGRHDADAERRADEHARGAESRLGLGGRPTGTTSASDRYAERPAPEQVTGLARTPGTPLAPAQLRRFGRAFDHDFSKVRIHADDTARTAAESIGARAFTVGDHIALPDPQPGILSHELGHVVEQAHGRDSPGMVRRLGVGEWFARLFGEGTYTDDELNSYLLTLDQTNKIEDTNESDDKARQVVKTGLWKKAFTDQSKSLRVRQLMIEEMLSGFTGDDDEQAILRVFEDSSMPEREWLLKKVGKPVLEDNFHGEEFHKLEALFSGIFKAKDNKVPLDWRMEYRLAGDLRGISADPNVKKGVLLRRLAYKPVGDPQSQTVATDEELTGPPLSTTQLTKTPLEHPRDKGGDGSAEIQVGQVDKENLVVPATDVTPTTPMQYPAIDPLNKQVTATLDVTMKAEEIGDTRKTSGTRDTHATGTRDSTATAVGREDSREESVDVSREDSATESAQLDYEKRLAKKREREKSTNKSQTESEEKGTETQKRKDTTKSESETKGSETFGQTEKIGGSAEFSGKMDAKLTGELKKASESKLVTVGRWALRLGRLLPGQYGKILKVLGPVGEKILDLFKPGEDDLEIEFDAEGNFSLKGTFRAESSVKGWRKFQSTTKGTSTTEGKTDVESQKKGASKTQGTGTAEREGEEVSEALKQGVGATQGVKKTVGAGTKKGSKDSTSTTTTHEKFDETRHEDFNETAITRKDFVAIVEKATLTFKVM